MDKLTDEFYNLKLALSPVLAFIDEIRLIRKSRRISEESSITIMGLLTLDIKEDVLTSVRSLQIEEEKRMEDIEEKIRDTQKEMRDKFYDYSQNVTNLEMDLHNLGDLIARQGSFLENQNRNFDGFKKDLVEKANAKEIIELEKKLKKLTPLAEFNNLANQVSEYATRSSLDLVRKDLLNLEKRVKIFSTVDEVKESILKSEHNFRGYVHDNFIAKAHFDEEKKFNVKRFDRMEDDIRVLYQKIDSLSEMLKKKVKEILEVIKKKPWQPDADYLQSQINECSTRAEFENLLKFVNPKIESFSYTVTEISGKVNQFEKIIERYDEIILDKASKDDVSIINLKLPGFTPLTSHNDLINNFEREADMTHEQITALYAKHDEVLNGLNLLGQRFELIKKENLEVASIASTLISIGEKISEKADKSDIYLIYDVMGRKEEILNIREIEEVYKKQLETVVVVLQSLCRTLLKNGESPATMRKQRFDLYRNLTNLLAWINGEEGKDPRITPSNKSPVNLKTDFDLEVYTDLLASARLTRKIRRNVMTTSPRNKTSSDFVNLPPIG